MHITTRQLRRLAADVDDLHRNNLKTFATESADLHRDVYIARRSVAALDDQSIAGYAQSIELAAVAAYMAAAMRHGAGGWVARDDVADRLSFEMRRALGCIHEPCPAPAKRGS